MDILLSKIHNSLIFFAQEIQDENWLGREREMVSRYAFCYLDKVVDKELIGIEVGVKQIKSGKKKHKDIVNKDLVIWKYPH